MEKKYYVYILANKSNMVLYIGVTNDLTQRITHKKGFVANFVNQFDINRLIYAEKFDKKKYALQRANEICSWSRAKKDCLIGVYGKYFNFGQQIYSRYMPFNFWGDCSH